MADRLTQTYLVEHYRPGVAVEDLRRSAARVRETIAAEQHEGHRVASSARRSCRATTTCTASSKRRPRRSCTPLLAQAGIAYERISTAITVEG